MLEKIDKTVVVVSQIGQLKHAETLLTSLNIQHATVIILYSSQNIKMPALIMESVNRRFFSEAILVEIHPQSNHLNPEAVRFNRRVYGKALDQTKPTSLFVCSYERHYALLCSEAQKRGIRISLFEEGAGSLKGIVPNYISFHTPTLKSTIDQIYNRLWKKSAIMKYMALPIYRIGRELIRTAMLPYLTTKELMNAPYFNEAKLTKSDPDYVFGWKRFDKVYSSNPEIMKQIFDASEYIELPTSFNVPEEIEKARAIIEKYGIDDRTAIFTSQRYNIGRQTMIDGVVACLQKVAEQTGYRILIKLHPKELTEMGPEYERAIIRAGEFDIKVIEDGHVPAEYLLVHSESPAVIGISSSTLIYAPKAKKSLRSITIGTELLKEFKSVDTDSPGIQLMTENIKILEYIPYIEKFKPDDMEIEIADGRLQEASH